MTLTEYDYAEMLYAQALEMFASIVDVEYLQDAPDDEVADIVEELNAAARALLSESRFADELDQHDAEQEILDAALDLNLPRPHFN